MDAFVSTYVWPAIIMVAQSLLLLVALLLGGAVGAQAVERPSWLALALSRSGWSATVRAMSAVGASPTAT